MRENDDLPPPEDNTSFKGSDRRKKKKIGDILKEKTFKREYAAVMMAMWVSTTIKIFWFVEPTNVVAYENLHTSLSWAVFTFVAAVAGIHVFRGAAPPPPRS